MEDYVRSSHNPRLSSYLLALSQRKIHKLSRWTLPVMTKDLAILEAEKCQIKAQNCSTTAARVWISAILSLFGTESAVGRPHVRPDAVSGGAFTDLSLPWRPCFAPNKYPRVAPLELATFQSSML